MMRRRRPMWAAVVFFLSLHLLAHAQSDKPSSKLDRREALGEAVLLEGLIRLDVTVTDSDGEALSNLQRDDFSLFDNGQAQKIRAFRGPGVSYSPPEPPTSVILFIDTLDLEPSLANFEREQTAKFLRRNGGHLIQPFTIYSLDKKGFSLLAKQSRDGNDLATAIESDSTVRLFFRPSGSYAATIAKDYSDLAPITAIRAVGTIAANQSVISGRKLLLWIGPGLRKTGSGSYMEPLGTRPRGTPCSFSIRCPL